MNIFRPARLSAFVLTFSALAALVLVGCGKKGPVRPLARPLPAAPGEIRLEQLGSGLLLSWTIPRFNQDGSPLEDLERFEIYKMSFDPSEDCPECRDTSVPWRRVDLEYPGTAFRSQNRIWIWDDDTEVGQGYQYRVIPFTFGNRAGDAALAKRPVLPPPPAPGGVSAEAFDRLVRLRWQPSPRAAVEGEWLGFRIYRRQTEEKSRFRPIHSGYLEESRYEDFELKNNQRYEYGLRSAVRLGDLVVESPMSAVVSARPEAGR